MEDRIPLTVTEQAIGPYSQQTVNARDLHAFLGVRRDFTSWIKNRIGQWGFVEGRDYICFEGLSSPISVSAKSRPQKTTEYALTLDIAKELSMIERTEKGRQARLYFIECERRYRLQEKERQASAQKTDRTPEELSSLLHLYAASVKAHKSNGLNHFQAVIGAWEVLLREFGFDINQYLILRDAAFLARVGKISNERPTQDLSYWYPDEDTDPEKKH